MRSLIAVLAAVPSLVLAYLLVNVWLDPMAWSEGSWVPYGVGLLLMEFLILHSSVFIAVSAEGAGSLAGKLLRFAGLAALYGLMGLGFALATDSPSLLWVLIAIMGARFANAIRANIDHDSRFAQRAALGVVAYLGVAAFTIAVDVPPMGITQEVLDEVYPGRGGGLWEQEPERAIVGGAIYFALMGIAELVWGVRTAAAPSRA